MIELPTMNLSMTGALAAAYQSGSQRAHVVTGFVSASQRLFLLKHQFISFCRDLDFIAPPSRTLRRDKPGLNSPSSRRRECGFLRFRLQKPHSSLPRTVELAGHSRRERQGDDVGCARSSRRN
jgi:hypothetical protein